MFPARRRYPLFVSAAVLLLSFFAARPASAAPPRLAPANIRLTRALPSEIARLLVSPAGFLASGEGPAAFAPDGTLLPSAALLPPGIVSLAPDDVARVLRVQGTPAGVSALREMVRLLDVPRAPIRLRVRLVREQELPVRSTRTGEDLRGLGGGFIQILATANATTGNGVPVPVTLRAPFVGDVIAVVRPRINGDGSVTLALDLRVVDPASGGATLRFLRAERRLRLGEKATFSALDVPGKGPDAKPERIVVEITPEKTGPQLGRE